MEKSMSTRQWLDSLTREERDSFKELSGVNYAICAELLRENCFRLEAKKRYSFVENMTRLA